MSRKKNRSRAAFSREALRSALPNANPSLAKLFSQIMAGSGFPPQPQVASLVDKWHDAYIDTMETFPESLVEAFHRTSYLTYQVTAIYSTGMIAAHCVAGDEAFKVFVNHLGAKPLVGCNCSVSQGIGHCVHSYGLLEHVTDLLDNHYNSLTDRIRNRRFDTGKPDMSVYQFDARAQVRRVLAGLLPRGPVEVSEQSDADSLPPLEEVQATRIVWNVEIKHNSLEICPMLQQAKKRGDGWTKGRRVSLENLREHVSVLTDADRKVRELVRIDTTYYRATYSLDSVEALKCLVGQPHVLLDGQPAEIQSLAPVVCVLKDAESVRLAMRDSMLGVSRFVFSSDCIVHLRHDIGMIQLCNVNSAQIESLRAIVRMPRIPLAHETELLETARRLQPLLNVELPEAVAGKCIEEEYRPVMLLRSRTDGALDYGLRLRDTVNRLLAAGVGSMVRHAEQEGKPVQFVRSAEREQRLCAQMVDQFALPSREMFGTVNSFEVALQLIETLHTAESTGEVEILWDKASQQPLRVLGAISAKNVSVGISKKRDWFQLSGSAQVGDKSIELSELLSGLQAAGQDAIHGEYVRLGDKGWAKISMALRKQLKALHDSVNQERNTLKFDMTSAPAIRELLAQDIEMKATAAWNQCLARLEKAERLEPVLPEGIQADLRDYQRDGFKWLRRLAEWGVGGILADDMGLGKTLQTLAVLLDRAHQGPALVIAPTSVGFNWVREAQRFAPTLDVYLYRETERADFLQHVGPNSLVVCSYGLALRDAEALATIQWASMVLDEAQAIKNSRSKTSIAIATIPADWKLALTGTPVENHLGELWSLFHVVSPGVLGGWEQFRRRFAAPIEKDNDDERRLALRDRLRPFLLRRTKEEVLKDLPPRTEMNVYVEMTRDEREVYDKVRLSALGEIDALAKLSDVKDQRFRILALLTRMRQLACSPRLVHEDWKGRSTKTQQLCDTLLELRDEGHRVLVFSQFVKHLSLIREMLEEEKISYVYLDGSTEAHTRQERVDDFQDGDATVFLISLKAGGTGLNLTAADYVIHMDPWWNPAVEDQATDRAHRIGQEKPVMVYRLVSQGTIEEEILKLHDSKRDLVAGIMEGAQAAAKLSTDDLIALLRT
ncbi:MAG: DEAD/DEAH box helicase [Pirellulaceae bacterium]